MEHVERLGGKVLTDKPLQEILVNEEGGIEALILASGEKVIADEYVIAVPVDCFKRLIPRQWSTMPFFRQLDDLEGVPVSYLAQK